MNKLILVFVLLFTASCQNKNVSNSLFAQDWQLQKISGNDLKGPHQDEMPFLSFSEHDRSLSGHTGCNRLAGSFHYTSSGELAFSQTAASKMFCENSLEEQMFLQNLSTVKSYEVKEEELLMFDEEKNIVLQFSVKTQK